MKAILTAVWAFILAAVYRFRGGGFISTGSDSLVRTVWGCSLALCFIFLHGGVSDLAHIIYAISIIPLAFVSLAFIPHGFCMNQGSGPHPWPLQGKGFAGYWPAAWLPNDFTQAEYDAMPYAVKAVLDFFGMVSVGIVRGFIVFAPWAAWCLHTGDHQGVIAAAVAIGVKGLGSGLAYLIGDHFPLNLCSSLSAHAPDNDNTDWGEFFEGMAWTVAVRVFCILGA